MSPAPQKIGRYRIVGRLGKGAMGVVYSAHDDVMGRAVAIKVMMADFEEDPETSERFYREARAAGQLVHRNIITIFDLGEEDGRPYIVMELLEGRILSDYLKSPGASDLERNVDLMIQVCDGLHIAHLHGIYHRDVKPSNLSVSEDGVVKILDFGIARISSSNLTSTGLIVGTPDYMSPEQARGQDVDQRSDIFSAGAVFYYMLTGRKPFAAPDLPGVLRKVELEDPLPIRDTEAPPELARIVMKALAKSQAERYQNAAQVIADLRRVKRDLELRAQDLASEAAQRLAAIESTLVERSQLCERLGVAPEMHADAIRERIASAHQGLATWPATPPQLESLGLTAITAVLAEINRNGDLVSLETADMRQAESALRDGERAVETSDWQLALIRFDAAAQAVPSCTTARDAAARCRHRLSERQAIDDRVAALRQQAEQAVALAQWQTVVAMCDEALAVNPDAADISALRDRAIRARDNETADLALEEQLARARADELRLDGKDEEAEHELARARGPELDTRHVETANRDAGAAELAFQAGDPKTALKLASQALTADPRNQLAQKISGLATARLREEAQTRTRTADAARHLLDASELLSRGKYQKARSAVDRASQLDPANAEIPALMAQIATDEARATAERERLRQAQQRAQAAAPVLAMARAAVVENDFARALWTAENALALDLDCVEAREIVQVMRAKLEAQPSLADETVDTTNPDDTVSLDGRSSAVRRLATIIKKWIHWEWPLWSLKRPDAGPRARQ